MIMVKSNESDDEKCFNCGKSVRWGSSNYVNRSPSFDDYYTRKANGYKYPEGAYCCADCELQRERELAIEIRAESKANK